MELTVIEKHKALKELLKIFMASFVLGGILEYLFSYFYERYIGIAPWDYSNILFNFNGRTSLLHCIYFGIGGILFIKILYPYISKLDKIYKKRIFKVLTVFLVIFMTFINCFHKI